MILYYKLHDLANFDTMICKYHEKGAHYEKIRRRTIFI